MKRVLQSIKDVFLGENPKKNHLMYLSMLILPAIASSIIGYIDKETPKDALFIYIILALIFLVLSIVPLLYLLGYGMEFYELRLNSEKGIPTLSNYLLKKGLKAFPLTLAWSLYYILVAILFIFLPIFFAITSAMTFINSPVGSVAIIVLTIIMILTTIVALALLCPFTQFIVMDFVKTYEYKSQYFNPLTLIGFIKKAFKDTILVMLKMFVAGFLLNIGVSILSGIITLIFIPVTLISTGAMESNPIISLLTMLPLLVVISLLNIYSTNIINFAAADLYVEVYKNKIETQEEETETI